MGYGQPPGNGQAKASTPGRSVGQSVKFLKHLLQFVFGKSRAIVFYAKPETFFRNLHLYVYKSSRWGVLQGIVQDIVQDLFYQKAIYAVQGQLLLF